MATPLNLSVASPRYEILSSFQLFRQRKSTLRRSVAALLCSHGDSSFTGFSGRSNSLSLKLNQSDVYSNLSNGVIEARRSNPPIMPAIVTPRGLLDLSTVMFRNRVIFVGWTINSWVAQRVISQLVTLAAIDEKSDILMYLNCYSDNTSAVLAIYDCMSWIKPKVSTICFGQVASQASLLLAGGEKGMRYAMPNARIMITQPLCESGGNVVEMRNEVNEGVKSRHKIDQMYCAFTGQPLDIIQRYTERNSFFSASQAMDFGLIDGIIETKY